MANEGSTKPTYSELEAENLRVRGLLQRIHRMQASSKPDQLLMKEVWELVEAELRATLVPSGAESADIGKLDSADEKMCKCGHSDDEHDDGRLCCTHRKSASLFCSCNQFGGSAETGGEKAADDLPEDTHPLAARLRKMADNVPPDFNTNDDQRDGYYAGVFDAAAELDIALAESSLSSPSGKVINVEGEEL